MIEGRLAQRDIELEERRLVGAVKQLTLGRWIGFRYDRSHWGEVVWLGVSRILERFGDAKGGG